MLVCIGSPHARGGQLWLTYQRHFGADGDPLILGSLDDLFKIVR